MIPRSPPLRERKTPQRPSPGASAVLQRPIACGGVESHRALHSGPNQESSPEHTPLEFLRRRRDASEAHGRR